MLVDLHAHYPMHLYPEARTRIGRRLRRSRSIFRLVRQQQAWFRALLVGLASLFINYRSIFSGPRVRMIRFRSGGSTSIVSTRSPGRTGTPQSARTPTA